MNIAEDTFFAPEEGLVTVDISPSLRSLAPQLGEPMEFRLTISKPEDEDDAPFVEAVETDGFPEEILLDLNAAKGMDPRWIRASFIVEMNLTNGHALYTWTNDDGDYRDLDNAAFLMKRIYVKMADEAEGATDEAD